MESSISLKYKASEPPGVHDLMGLLCLCLVVNMKISEKIVFLYELCFPTFMFSAGPLGGRWLTVWESRKCMK